MRQWRIIIGTIWMATGDLPKAENGINTNSTKETVTEADPVKKAKKVNLKHLSLITGRLPSGHKCPNSRLHTRR